MPTNSFERGIIPKEEKVLDQENSQLLQQLNDCKPTFTTHAGDPTVNDDIDLGYKVGHFWLNTTDKGLFVCCDNTDGAADWDEITKV